MKIPPCAVIIPALDEESALPLVLADLSAAGLLPRTIVVDNGSRDRTAAVAGRMGAHVVEEPRRGYGAACLRGLEAMRTLLPDTEIVVFMDADHSDDASRLPALLEPLIAGAADMVLGARDPALAEKGSLRFHQRAGTAAVCALIGLLFGRRFADLGPFRAVRRGALERLRMGDRSFGWTVEMQVKALLSGLRVMEIPVPYRARVGVSKISGTLRGSAAAAFGMGWMILRLRAASLLSPARGSS
jgi:glycosyltransferase involved in cell wall biosynthesis